MKIFVILVKIYRNGFKWLYKRVKFEFLSPKFSATKYLVKHMEYLRKKFSQKKIATHTDIVSPDTLLVVYDLNFQPITFDFANFIAAAETFGKNEGKSKIFVLFVRKESTGLINGEYSNAISEDSQQWRINNVILQLAHLYPACTGYSIVPRESEILKFIPDKSVYPAGYSNTYKPNFDYTDIFKLLNLKLFSGFKAPKQGIDYIHKWQKVNGISKPMVVITIRQYGYDLSRNSNIEEWVKFAYWVRDQGFTPIIVPDTDACWIPNNLFDDFLVFTEPCWNLGLRIALYELAFVNLFYNNGVAAIATLNKKSRYILFNPIIEQSLESNSSKRNKYGLIIGQRRYNFAEQHQFFSWKLDSFENIQEEFVEFQKYCPLD